MSSTTSSPRERLAYIDWLRFIVVLLLAPFHAALSFTGVGSVYVYDTPVRDILLAGGTPVNVGPYAFTIFISFLDNWFMHLLFFVSGIGAALSLRKRSAGQFMGERSNRLGFPLLVGTVFIISVQTWLGDLSFGRFSGSYFAYLPQYFKWGTINYGHFWFLAYLFVFSALALPLFLSIRRMGAGSRFFSIARRFAAMPLILLPALWTGLLDGLLRPGWPVALNLVNDWAVFLGNLSFFLTGYIAASVPELLQGIEKHRRAALYLGLTAFLARGVTTWVVAVPEGYNAANIIAYTFRGIAAYGLVLAAIGYGQRYLTSTGRWLGIARDLSFPLYVLHYLPVTAATYLLLETGLSIWVRFFITVAATLILVAVFTLLAKFVPPLRSFFSIRPPKVKAP
jgi:glucan biosynthesis protein C